MMPTERSLRDGTFTRDDWPAQAIVDRLASDGHAPSGFCEKCWQAAGWRAVVKDPFKTQGEHYLDICREVEATAATKETD